MAVMGISTTNILRQNTLYKHSLMQYTGTACPTYMDKGVISTGVYIQQCLFWWFGRHNMLKIYKLSQTENRGYDTYDSCVVIAESPEAARQISPTTDSWDEGYNEW